jgi:hypothetical protein
MPVEKIEIGTDQILPIGNFFILDDPVKGQLNNATYTLAGFTYYDITDYVTGYQITRGKDSRIGQISAGDLVVTFNNEDRFFDPTYEDSPAYGLTLPKRLVRVSSNDVQQFQGVINDWNLSYQPFGKSIASLQATDGFVYLNNQTLSGGTATAQFSGARINAILDSEFVEWPADKRNIDTGASYLGADVIEDNTNVLQYLQLVESSEQGLFFVDKEGNAVFRDRNDVPTSQDALTISDNPADINYSQIQIAYGSEDLANEVVATSAITNTQVTVTDTVSQAQYGIFNLTLDGLLVNSDAQLEDIAAYLVNENSEPSYRFDSIDIILNNLSLSNQTAVLSRELGDTVKVEFTPNGISPSITKYAQIIRIAHRVDIQQQHIVTFGLSTRNSTPFVLDDVAFGRLDEGAIR